MSLLPSRRARLAALLSASASLLALAACGEGHSSRAPTSRVQGLPGDDANVAALRATFARSGAARPGDVVGRTWNCVQFSAMKDIHDTSAFVRTFDSFGALLLTNAIFSGARSSGTVSSTPKGLRGGVTGTTDGFVFPYSNAEIEIRRQSDGTLIEEWTVDPEAMVVSLKHGLTLSAIAARQWMEPAVSNPARLMFVYAVCRPQ